MEKNQDSLWKKKEKKQKTKILQQQKCCRAVYVCMREHEREYVLFNTR